MKGRGGGGRRVCVSGGEERGEYTKETTRNTEAIAWKLNTHGGKLLERKKIVWKRKCASMKENNVHLIIQEKTDELQRMDEWKENVYGETTENIKLKENIRVYDKKKC